MPDVQMHFSVNWIGWAISCDYAGHGHGATLYFLCVDMWHGGNGSALRHDDGGAGSVIITAARSAWLARQQ